MPTYTQDDFDDILQQAEILTITSPLSRKERAELGFAEEAPDIAHITLSEAIHPLIENFLIDALNEPLPKNAHLFTAAQLLVNLLKENQEHAMLLAPFVTDAIDTLERQNRSHDDRDEAEKINAALSMIRFLLESRDVNNKKDEIISSGIELKHKDIYWIIKALGHNVGTAFKLLGTLTDAGAEQLYQDNTVLVFIDLLATGEGVELFSNLLSAEEMGQLTPRNIANALEEALKRIESIPFLSPHHGASSSSTLVTMEERQQAFRKALKKAWNPNSAFAQALDKKAMERFKNAKEFENAPQKREAYGRDLLNKAEQAKGKGKDMHTTTPKADTDFARQLERMRKGKAVDRTHDHEDIVRPKAPAITPQKNASKPAAAPSGSGSKPSTFEAPKKKK